MSTFMPKAGEVARKWYVLDAAGKPLGRVAAEAAVLLRDFPRQPHGGGFSGVRVVGGSVVIAVDDGFRPVERNGGGGDPRTRRCFAGGGRSRLSAGGEIHGEVIAALGARGAR